MNRWKKRVLIVLIAIALNVLGRYVAFSYNLPAYLNLGGTILTAYFEGPLVGMLTAFISCAFSSLFSSGDWYFLIADLSVAVASGLIAKHNRFFERFSLIISATAFFAVIKALFLLVINLSIYGGRSGLQIADAIVDYLVRISFPTWLGYLTTALFISFTDSLAAVFLIFFALSIGKNIWKRKRAAKLKKELRKKVITGLFLAFALSAALGNSHVYAHSVGFREKLYNSDNGLAGGCLNDIAMTRDGSMWIATYGGLFRFNGSRFILIDNLKCVRSVQSLFVDEEDRLWAGTQDSGVTLMNIDMSWETIDLESGLPSNSVKCISRDSNGLYYFGTTAGIAYAQYENGKVKVLGVDLQAGNIKDLSPDSEGNMIVMNNVGELSCYKAGECIAKLSIAQYTPKGIKHDSEGNLYIGTEAETILIYEFRSGRFRVKDKIKAEGMKTIRDFYFDESGVIYVAADNGIGYVDNTRHFTQIESGEFNNSIDHIFKDYQGNLWFTSSRCGLLCLGKSCFTDVFKLCNEKSIVCNAIKQWNGYLYIGTNDGLKILDVSAGESIKNEITDLFNGTRIRSLDIDLNGNLLVATYDIGLMQITPKGVASEYVSSSETDKMIRVVCCLSDGTVISSGDRGMVFMKDHTVIGKLRLGQDLEGGTVLNILETEDHTLLCGTDADGIAVIKDGKLERYIGREAGLPSEVILRVVKDKRGNGYFVMTGSGVCYMDQNYRVTELGMPYYNNFDVAMNENGELFVLGGAGIYVCDYEAFIHEGLMETYTLLDSEAGLPGSITSNAWNLITEDEFIYICGSSGVYMLDLNNYEMRVDTFKTKITSIKKDGVYEDVTQIGTITIPRGTKRVELDLEINNFTSADPYISYYLSSVDKEKTISLASKLGSITYIDIPYGNHDFVISVQNEKGKELSRQLYVISKEKELYETVGFTLYFNFLLFTFIAFIVTSIVQGALWSQRKKETDKHELVVSQLEREKAEALERALHMEEDANKSKSEFLANMSHKIRTPINAIVGMNTMIIRESKETNIQNYANDIHSAGATLLSLIDDILDFSVTESGSAALAEKERYHAPDARILLVDDIEMNHTVAKNLLKRIEAKVDSALSGEEALQHALEQQYDIILIESRMSGMKGEDILHGIRTKCPLNAQTPVIVLTTHAVSGAREEYLNLGYTNYLSKPLDAVRLEAMIQSYLPDEKILLTDEDQTQQDMTRETARMLKTISEIEGIDSETGVDIAGSEEAYVLLCRNFHKTAPMQTQSIMDAYTKEDYDRYAIQLHTLKNAARLIGATGFSMHVEELENAGREGANERIRKENEALMQEYRELSEKLGGVFES